jgi:hypothetical protein
MRAQLGADDVQLFQRPEPGLLRKVSGLAPEPGGLHVLLDGHRVRSTQRLALSLFRDGLVVALWPAELKPQAEYLYGERLGTPMVARATERGWFTAGSPHLAFRNSAPAQRLYMIPACDAREYARRWEDGDLGRVGQHTRREIEEVLWPWLKSSGYADEDDDRVLRLFLDGQLGRRPAYLRPGLRLRGEWDADAVTQAGGLDGLAAMIRSDVNSILAAANEPPLPATRS